MDDAVSVSALFGGSRHFAAAIIRRDMPGELKLFYAILIGSPDLPSLPACFITAASDLDAITQARRRLGAWASFDLWTDGALVLRHRPVRRPIDSGTHGLYDLTSCAHKVVDDAVEAEQHEGIPAQELEPMEWRDPPREQHNGGSAGKGGQGEPEGLPASV